MAPFIRPPLIRGTTSASPRPSASPRAARSETSISAASMVTQANAQPPPAPTVAAAEPSLRPGLQTPLSSGFIKASMPYDHYHQAVGLRVIHLLDADATSTRVLMTETQKQGAFGKLKFGYDAAHERVALKEMRLVAAQPEGALSKFGHPKTLPMAVEDVLQEAERTAIARTLIDSHIAAAIAARGGVDPWGALRSKVSAYHVKELIGTQNAIYMVVTAESGDLADLTLSVTSGERATFALSAAAQLFFEASVLHANGLVHLDIKKDNMVFTEHGQIKLVDFGLLALRAQGASHLGLRGPRGTNPAPEMLLTDDDLDEHGNWQSVPLTEAVDVWLMAIAVLQLLDPLHDRDNPLLYQHDAQGRRDHVATSTRLAHFEVWRREALDKEGHARPDVLREDNIFSRYIARLHRVHPALCDLLLSHALVARVDLRASAKQMTQNTLDLVQQMNPQQQTQARRVFERGHQALGQPAVYAGLDRYQAWLAAQNQA